MNIPAARVLEWACLPCAVCVYRQTVEFLRRSVLDDEVSQFRNAKSDLFDCAPLPIRLHLLAYYLHQYKIGGVRRTVNRTRFRAREMIESSEGAMACRTAV